jgi:threonine dehydrogenase-like Zn-dependent dehydrogenase
MRTCRAAIVRELGKPLLIEEVPVPNLESGALLVRMTSSTLCGTDVHRWRGGLGMKAESLPFITGHEPCGVVEQILGERTDIVGDAVRVGDRIVWSYVSCGSCYYCSVAVQPCICPNRMSWGHNRSDRHPYLLGSVSEYMYVPPQCLIVKVPENVSSSSAAASACAYRTCMHAFDRLGAIKSHETVLIQGSGPIGIFCATVAKEHGAGKVIMIGAPAVRLHVALRMGADDVLDLGEVADPVSRREWVLEQTNGRGADVIFQCASNAAVPEGLAMLRAGGRFVNIGVGGRAAFDLNDLPQQLTFLTVRSGEPRHWLQALEFMSSRAERYRFEDMITARYPLEDINIALNDMASFKVVKAAIEFQ